MGGIKNKIRRTCYVSSSPRCWYYSSCSWWQAQMLASAFESPTNYQLDVQSQINMVSLLGQIFLSYSCISTSCNTWISSASASSSASGVVGVMLQGSCLFGNSHFSQANQNHARKKEKSVFPAKHTTSFENMTWWEKCVLTLFSCCFIQQTQLAAVIFSSPNCCIHIEGKSL